MCLISLIRTHRIETKIPLRYIDKKFAEFPQIMNFPLLCHIYEMLKISRQILEMFFDDFKALNYKFRSPIYSY